MEVDELIIGKAQIKYQSPKRILDSIKKMIELVGDTLSQENRQERNTGGFVVGKKNIAVSVWDIKSLFNNNNNNKGIFIFGGYLNSSSYSTITVSDNSSTTIKKDQEESITGNEESTIQSIINIPWKVIQKHKHSYVSSVNYQNSGLFMDGIYLNKLLRRGGDAMPMKDGAEDVMIKDGSKDVILGTNGSTSRRTSLPFDIVRSNVFDVSIGNESISNLDVDERIGLQFRNAVPVQLTSSGVANDNGVGDDGGYGNDDDISCRFWKFSASRNYFVSVNLCQS